jgi:hypothetical protein
MGKPVGRATSSWSSVYHRAKYCEIFFFCLAITVDIPEAFFMCFDRSGREANIIQPLRFFESLFTFVWNIKII